MRAAVYTAVKRIEFQDRPLLKAGPGEVVVKIKYCGICSTDGHIYFEGILPPGIVLGHENVGTVAEVGEGVDGWKVGDRVIAGPPDLAANATTVCTAGLPSVSMVLSRPTACAVMGEWPSICWSRIPSICSPEYPIMSPLRMRC